MTSKEELECWNKGTLAYANGDMSAALELFRKAGNYAKPTFNIGMIYTRTGDFDSSEYMFEKAIELDEFMAVAYLQRGYSLFMLGEYRLAESDFKHVFKLLLNNDYIDYEQLGLNYKLYRAEVLFNLAMCYDQLGYDDLVLRTLDAASTEAKTDDQRKLIEPWASRGKGDTVLFTVPLKSLFRVPDVKVKNLEKKKYMQNAKLVVATDTGSTEPGFIGFTGATMLDSSLSEAHGVTLARKKAKEPPRVAASDKYAFLSDDAGTIKSRNQEGSISGRSRGPSETSSSRRRPSEPIIKRQPPSDRRPSEDSEGRRRRPSSPQIRQTPNSPSNDSAFHDSPDQIEIKIHYKNKIKKLRVLRSIRIDHLMKSICDTFQLDMKNKDLGYYEEDGDELITVFDQDDLDLALDGKKSKFDFYVQTDNILDYY